MVYLYYALSKRRPPQIVHTFVGSGLGGKSNSFSIGVGLLSSLGYTVNASFLESKKDLESTKILKLQNWKQQQPQQQQQSISRQNELTNSKTLSYSSTTRRTHHYSTTMEGIVSSKGGSGNPIEGLADFLVIQKKKLESDDASNHFHFSLGNPAGDADSIISAITVAYVESVLLRNANEDIIPIVSIPCRSLQTQRPETTYLLRLAGIPIDSLVCIDHPSIQKEASNSNNTVTLVDHNSRTFGLVSSSSSSSSSSQDEPFSWQVVEILDHHLDEGMHQDGCFGKSRDIAFDAATQKALVASTCTLIVERYLSAHDDKDSVFPSPLAILLLGTIVLDSVNMSPLAGKGTPRDAVAIKALVEQTNWAELEEKNTRDDLTFLKPGSPPDLGLLFETLQSQKFNPSFWKQLTVTDALALDYKSFVADASTSSTTTGGPNNDSTAASSISFGVSSVLQSMEDFFGLTGSNDDASFEEEMSNEVIQYINDQKISFLGIMFATRDATGKHFKRQFALCVPDTAGLDQLEEFLLQSERGKSLQLERTAAKKVTVRSSSIQITCFEQHNAKASRKQVVPILLDYWKQT